MEENDIKLYSFHDSIMLLGCLMQNPRIILTGKYPLDRDDFAPYLFHRTLFAVIENLVAKGAREIDYVSVDKFIEPYEDKKELLNDNNVEDFIFTMKKSANIANIELYYTNVRKLSMLRDYRDQGSDISEIFDINKKTEEQIANLNNYTIDEIISYFDKKNLTIRKKFSMKDRYYETKGGEGMEEIVNEFGNSPYFGSMLMSPMLTTLWLGWCRGHLLLRSASSGEGKTTISIGDLCMVCATEYWDKESQSWVKNKNRQGAGLFIHTEMKTKSEIEPKFLAWIAHVNFLDILKGQLSSEEKERVSHAIDVMKESDIFLVNMPKFTVPLLEECIREYVENHDIAYMVFDYVQNNQIVGKWIAQQSGVTNLREDLILLALTDYLKGWAEQFNIGILTMTQLNGKEEINDILDEDCLRGGKAQVFKLDGGCIMKRPRKKELKQVQGLIDRRGFGEHLEPNSISHVYKARFNEYGMNLKVWQHIDLGSGRIVDLFTTTHDNLPVNLEPTIIEVED